MRLVHPKLDWRDASPVAAEYGDIYFSPDDALGEVRHNFIARVAPLFGQGRTLVIGETGFGTGLNFLLTWKDWWARRRPEDRLIFVSTEAHPLRPEDARRALAPFAEIADQAAPLLAAWPVGIPGPHRRFFAGRAVELWVLHGDALTELRRQTFVADAWYFDGFNPATNPGLWSQDLLHQCVRLMAPGAVAGTFTVAEAVRQRLADVGLQCARIAGFGRKRHCLKIWKPGTSPARAPLQARTLHIDGDGIAAAGLAWAARTRGAAASWSGVGAHHAHRASGNPAALVNFKPTQAPQVPSNRWLAASLAHVQPIYADLWLPGRGTLKPAATLAQAADFRACLAAMGWTETALTWADEGLFSPLAGYVAPAEVMEQLRADIRRGPADEGATVVHARGFGTVAQAPSLAAILRRNLGQVDLFAAGECPQVPYPVTYRGYLSPVFKGRVLAGSTYDRNPDWTAPEALTPRHDATETIAAKARAAGFDLTASPAQSFVAARAFAKDHRPLVGPTREGAWVLTGLGSRGFLTAPLLGEILLDQVEARAAAGVPTYDFAACLHPGRFAA